MVLRFGPGLRAALVAWALALWAGLAAAAGPLFLWELKDAGGALRGWLYGTIHVCDASCFPLPVPVREALAAADGLALELDPADPSLGPALARAGLLPKGAVNDLDILRQHNPLLFDFALKRLLHWQGHSFSPAVFNTRRLFAASQA